MEHWAEIGVFGGSGFYDFAESDKIEVDIDTPYGPPSEKITLISILGRQVAFLPRHGKTHSLPPHKIPYRANLWAFKKLGITRVIAPNAVGSLQPTIQPGHFVVNDQFVDRTSGRADTYFDGPTTTHVSSAEPYCPQLRLLACKSSQANGITTHESGTCVVIQGPRFSTKAESQWYTQMGWHTINMTQYPEVILAREMELCYVSISLVTDYDAGVIAGQGAVQATDVLAVLKQNTENVKRVITTMISRMPERTCACSEALKFATIE